MHAWAGRRQELSRMGDEQSKMAGEGNEAGAGPSEGASAGAGGAPLFPGLPVASEKAHRGATASGSGTLEGDGELNDAALKESVASAMLKESNPDYAAACEMLSQCLETRCNRFGDQSLEVAPTFFKYAQALFSKALHTSDVFGASTLDAMKNKSSAEKAMAKIKGMDPAAKNKEKVAAGCVQDEDQESEEGESSEESVSEDEGDDVEDDEEGEGGEDQEEEDDDMALAWEAFEVCRGTYQKHLDTHFAELADVLLAIGDVHMEDERFGDAVEEFTEALAVLDGRVSSNDRLLAEIYFRICMANQYAQKDALALASVDKAKSILEANMQEIKVKWEAVDANDVKEAYRLEKEAEALKGVLEDISAKRDELVTSLTAQSNAMRMAKIAGGQLANGMGAGASSSSGFDTPQLPPGAVFGEPQIAPTGFGVPQLSRPGIMNPQAPAAGEVIHNKKRIAPMPHSAPGDEANPGTKRALGALSAGDDDTRAAPTKVPKNA